eukprot:4423343-Prymnesium_polylepis.1
MEVAFREKTRSDALLTLSTALHSEELRAVQKAGVVMECVRMGLQCARSSMVLVDEVNGEQVVISTDRDAHGLRIPIDAAVSGQVISSGQLACIDNAEKDELVLKHRSPGFAVRNLLAVPVHKQGGSAGGAGGGRSDGI